MAQKHGHARGSKTTRTYQSWLSTKQRCFSVNHHKYDAYKRRGITMCHRWRSSFQNFLDDMGERPEGHQLTRLDITKGYNPENCEWQESSRLWRTQSTVLFTIGGQEKPLGEWSRIFDVNPRTVRSRFDKFGNPLYALTKENSFLVDDILDYIEANQDTKTRDEMILELEKMGYAYRNIQLGIGDITYQRIHHICRTKGDKHLRDDFDINSIV